MKQSMALLSIPLQNMLNAIRLVQLNPNLPQDVYDITIKQIEGLSEPTLIENNRQFHQMLLAGVKVLYQEKGKTKYYVVRLIDFDNPQKNEFLAVRQFYIRQYELKKLDHVIICAFLRPRYQKPNLLLNSLDIWFGLKTKHLH